MNKKVEGASKKTMVKFVVILLGALLAGFFGGMGMSALKNVNMSDFGAKAAEWYQMCGHYLFLAVEAILFVLSLVFYCQGKKMAQNWDGESEDAIEAAEKKLEYPIVFGNVALISNLAFFASGVWVTNDLEVTKSRVAFIIAFYLVVFILSYVWILILQNATIKVVKQINPEKQGSIFDSKFQKKWEESCDEAEKLMVYKSAWHAFKVVNTACVVLWLITLISMMNFHTGLFPVLCVCILYLIANLSYILESMRLEHKK